MMVDDKSYRTAIHESGHAVLGMHYGVGVEEVAILPDEGGAGYCRCEYPMVDVLGGDDPIALVIAEIACYYAGAVAHAIFLVGDIATGDHDDLVLAEEAMTDYLNSFAAGEPTPSGEELDELRDRGMAKTLILSYGDALVYLARLLVRRGKLGKIAVNNAWAKFNGRVARPVHHQLGERSGQCR